MTKKDKEKILAALTPLQIIVICRLGDHIGMWILPVACALFTISLLWYVGLDALKELVS